MLANLGILRESDAVAWDALWRTYDKYMAAGRAVAVAIESGDPEKIAAAARFGALELQYLGVLIKLLDRFGMNPSSRNAIGIEAPKGETKSEFEILRGRLAQKRA
jgi:phage terminase small subunit